MYGFHKPMLNINQNGLIFDDMIKLADADRHGRISFNKERCLEVLSTAYDCVRTGNQLPSGFMNSLARAVSNWNTGERHLRQEAVVAVAQIELREPARNSSDYVKRMEKFGLQQGSNTTKAITTAPSPAYLNEPRVPKGNPGTGGEWTTDDTAGMPDVELVAQHKTEEEIEQEEDDRELEISNFIMNNWVASVFGARELGIPPAYLLGFSAQETAYGTSRLVTQSNNFFNMHTNTDDAPDAIPSLGDGSVHKYKDYTDSLNHFISTYGEDIRNLVSNGKLSPETFTKLMQSHKFGINSDGTKNPDFTNGVPATIRSIDKRTKDFPR